MIAVAVGAVATMVGATVPTAAMANPVRSVAARQEVAIDVSFATLLELELRLDQMVPAGTIVTLGVHDSDAVGFTWRHELSTGWPPAVRLLSSWETESYCHPTECDCGEDVYFKYQALRAGTAEAELNLINVWAGAETVQSITLTFTVPDGY
jgi:hypothetical protein